MSEQPRGLSLDSLAIGRYYLCAADGAEFVLMYRGEDCFEGDKADRFTRYHEIIVLKEIPHRDGK